MFVINFITLCACVCRFVDTNHDLSVESAVRSIAISLSVCARLYSVHMSSTSILLIRVCMSVIRYMKRLTVPFAFTLVRFTVAILKHLNNTLSCTIEHVILANILTKHYHRWQWLEWPMQIRNNEFCAHKVSRKLCVFVKIETDSLPPFNPHCT